MARFAADQTTALGLSVYSRSGMPRNGLSTEQIERRVAALLAERGPMTMTELLRAFHFNVEQARLHRTVAKLRDDGAVTVRQERRFRTGRARVVVAPVTAPAAPGTGDVTATDAVDRS